MTKELFQKVLKKLKLHSGMWTLKWRGQLYQFPPELTRAEVERKLESAFNTHNN